MCVRRKCILLGFNRVSGSTLRSIFRAANSKFDENPEKDIVVKTCHPGYVKTDMSSGMGTISIDEGSQAPVYLALLPSNIIEPKGGYVWCNKEIVDWVNGPTPYAY